MSGLLTIHFPVWLKARETALSAHRGAVVFAPENTLEAFQQAVVHGYGAIEIDVQMSTDGELFLLHDSTVDRTTNGTGVASNMSWAQLSSLQIKTEGYDKYTDKVLRVPSFESVIEELSHTNLLINVDGSKGDWSNKIFTDKIVNTLRENGKFKDAFFVLSNKSVRDQFVTWYPDAIVCWLFSSSNSIDAEIANIKSYPKALISLALSDATDERLKLLDTAGVAYQVHLVNSQVDADSIEQRFARLIETDAIVP